VRLLILSFYYPPDLSAGSFRASSLVAAIRERAPSGSQVDVITTSPNRYQTFSQSAPEIEEVEGVRIRRIRLPAHHSDMTSQSRAFLHFARQACRIAAEGRYDLVFATSSRLMTAALGAWIARRQRVPLYLDIRDIFVDTISDVLGPVTGWPVRQVMSRLESWTMRGAGRINLVSRGFEPYFRARYHDRSFSFFTNGIDAEFITAAVASPVRAGTQDPVTVLYAGNIGEGQGLHEILPGLALALRSRVRFLVIGDGGRRAALEAALAAAGVSNVELRAPMPRARLLDAYRGADVLFLHLGSHAAFEKVLPSKLFEYAALGKPVLAGVAGYAARFVREEITNATVFSPCDVPQAVVAFDSLEIRDCPRPAFVAKYARTRIARQMADDVLAVACGRS
jgi:glycosyltransferase involved in cell wall biosynthesis